MHLLQNASIDDNYGARHVDRLSPVFVSEHVRDLSRFMVEVCNFWISSYLECMIQLIQIPCHHHVLVMFQHPEKVIDRTDHLEKTKMLNQSSQLLRRNDQQKRSQPVREAKMFKELTMFFVTLDDV